MTNSEYDDICEYLRGLTAGTEWSGHVFTVGGCCRDKLMGRPIHDVDLAVDLPDGGVRLARWLGQQGVTEGSLTLFEAFGTARLRLKRWPGYEIELVQTRREKYTDRKSRNPEVCFGSKEEDAARRDLTINSLYYDITTREVLDLTGRSLDDIRAKVIRTPSDPDATFDDDPVRILRCIRFACDLGWKMPGEVMRAMKGNADRLEIIRPERRNAEFEKIIMCADPVRAMEMLRVAGALRHLIPELYALTRTPHAHGSDKTAWDHTMEVLGRMPARLRLRLGALLHDIAKPKVRHLAKGGILDFTDHDTVAPRVIRKIAGRLRWRHFITDEVGFLARYHLMLRPYGDNCEKLKPRKLKNLLRLDTRHGRLDRLMTLIDAVNAVQDDHPHRVGQVNAFRNLMEKSGLVEKCGDPRQKS